ncbi:transcription antitermination factor NusB [Anaerobacillus isosaccharinicus]|uniref:Transcription antitermination protein NusB n=1 Tax=Anaerobacillus isosaccharinicus TaxID=1532552 RepID=A0A1S2MH79_9BACI|nr:transcription antitermination factor NusB [Anaerobacillus isosaccharinicus]MBA5585622.1 transcription antitermination factor NusB [Anaerobacillus isosaccharinicus]QOY36068.1 transcription antitermination factor NusB [Anaerobacillus isosaccharinicus]
MKRRLARIKAVQSLFQVDMSGTDKEEAINNVLEDDETKDEFLEKLVFGTLENLDEIDQIFKSHLENWKIDRVGNVDRAVIRMAIYEMKFVEEIPINVSLNEAVDVAKSFGGEESGRFVNGVISKIAETLKA